MSSQLNVDTIVDKAGSGGSNVKMANTSTYVSDGGAVTQNTVQGLGKVWTNVNMSSASINDSYNVGSITDNSAGNFTVTFSSSMANANYSNAGSTIGGYIGGHASLATGSFILRNGDSNWSAADQDTACVTTSGDLA